MTSSESVKFATDDVTVYLAAAGAGKTSALMDEMTELLEVYRPDEIAFVTFTRKGVANGLERATLANSQLSADDLVHFKTLHALCFRELGLKHASIIVRADMEKFNRMLGFEVTLGEAFGRQSEDDKLFSRYDAIRSGAKKGAYVHRKCDEARYTRLIKAYESFKEANNLVDFHDCLLRFRDAGRPVNVKVAFIDEAQDLTLLQWEVCQIAFSECEKVRIAGDDFQSLFTYAGASPRALVELARRHRTVKLETSYRLPKAVYRFAKGVTRCIVDKIDKDFKPAKDFEGFVEETSNRSLLIRRIRKDLNDNGETPHRWYLLFRNNCFIENVAGLLEQFTIPYHTAEDFCIPAPELAKLQRYYRYRVKGFGDKDSFERFCAENSIRDINEDFTESNLIPPEKRYVYFDYVGKYGIEGLAEMARKEPCILLSTTHKVKGGEADYVAVFLDCTRLVSGNALVNLDEELRVLYVACTRAKVGLFLVSSKSRYGLDKIVDMVKEQTTEEV
jgi:superfamily I DNA/RNA helicase